MVKVDKYVRQLLFEHDCVIIPDFGGLLTHNVGVYYDKVNGSFVPSSKRLAFNEILRIDDGLLTHQISRQENIQRDQAIIAVRQYVEGLRAGLAANHSISIDRIGNFSSNKEGKLVFEPDSAQNFDAGWYGFERIQIQMLPTQTEQNPETTTTEVGEITLPARKVVGLHSKSSRNRSRLGWVAAAVFAGTIVALSMSYRPMGKTMLSTLNPLASLENFFISTPDDDTKPVLPYAYAEAVPVPVTVWNSPASPQIITVSATTPEPAVPEVPVIVEAPEVKPVVAPQRPYQLIAGSFTSMKHVNILIARLAQKGYDNPSVVNKKHGKWIMVSAGSYESERAAYNDKKELDHDIGVESWVLKK